MNSYHQDVTRPIFVFGSNLKGVHGAGAALAARAYGAQLGIGEGPTGLTYAIPTKDERINTLPLARIEYFVKRFIQYTVNNPNLHFFVTRVGCGLAGYKDSQIAPMFKGAVNCSFPIEWKEYLDE